MNDRNMSELESALSVTVMLRDNELHITGEQNDTELTEQVIEHLILLMNQGENIDPLRIRYAVRLAREGNLSELDKLGNSDIVAITSRGKYLSDVRLCSSDQ